MKSNYLIFYLTLVLFPCSLLAQEKMVSGKVTDPYEMPMPGVNVFIEGTSTGTQTDFNGNYEISVSPGEVLVFSFLSYSTEERTVGSSDVINVVLEEEVGELGEVVVLGYTTRGVQDVTGSSVQVSGADIANIPVVSVDQALQGRVAGVQISQNSGTPGSVQDIRIRGLSSLTASNDPLYVIDGVPVVNEDLAPFEDNASTLSPLSAINAQDIASITVLKDASATAAYGARGSNGVIVITTKDGVKGKTQFSFSSSVGIQNDAFNKREVLTAPQRYELLVESLVNSYSEFGFTPENAIELGVENQLLSPAYLTYDGAENDWAGEIRNDDALLQNYNFSASGGDEKGSFYASLGYNRTEGTVIGADFERLNGSFSFDRNLRDNLKLSTSINASNLSQDAILEGGTFFANPFIVRYLMNPFNPIRNADGEYNIDLQFGSLPNIFYVMENDMNRNTFTRGMVNTKLDWELIDDLTFSNRASIDYQLLEYKSYLNRYEGSAASVLGWAEANDEKNYNFVYQGSLNYNFKVAQDHHFDMTALFEYQTNQNSSLYGYGENFPTDGLINIGSASANYDSYSDFNDWYNVSYLGLLNYNYAGKYVFDATYRREGSSRFAAGQRFGDFGSAGVAWNVHREDFMSDSVFNELRLRSSYGITGNNAIDINSYQALLSYDAAYASSGAAYASQFGNPDLTWEKGETFDVGLSFGLLQDRLTGSFNYYNRRTYDLLQEVPLSLTTGFENQFRNVGEMVNKGIEVELGADIINQSGFVWNVSANYATVDNEVTELAIGADGEPIDPLSGVSYKSTRVGLPADAWFMKTWAGVDPATGNPTWYVNGVDGEVTSNFNNAERVYQGASPLPTYSGGLGTSINYKGFFADANLYFAGGHKIYEQYAQFYLYTNSFTLGSYNGAQELLERWQEPGDITDVPRLAFGTSNNFQNTSSRHLYEGDYVRLKNLTIGYKLPAQIVETIGIDDLTISLRGTNMATWVKDEGLKLDPEVRANGYTYLTTPPVESYTLGVNLKF